MVWAGWPILLLWAAGILDGVTSVSLQCVKNMGVKPEPYLTWNNGIQRNISCDTHTDGGGWIFIQKRYTNDTDFNRRWNDYKFGFGSFSGNFWLGNIYLHLLTTDGEWEARFDIKDNGNWYHVYYSRIQVDNEENNFKLTLSGTISGNLRDNAFGMSFSNDQIFSTRDRYPTNQRSTCNSKHKCGWWLNHSRWVRSYGKCTRANPNGQWRVENRGGVYWNDRNCVGCRRFDRWLQATEFKIRRK